MLFLKSCALVGDQVDLFTKLFSLKSYCLFLELKKAHFNLILRKILSLFIIIAETGKSLGVGIKVRPFSRRLISCIERS